MHVSKGKGMQSINMNHIVYIFPAPLEECKQEACEQLQDETSSYDFCSRFETGNWKWR